MAIHRGSCHCGNVVIELESAASPSALPVRACQCSFCRKHGARSTSDPQGRVTITVREPEQLLRYRFGLATADFLVCARCGIYVGAVTRDDGTPYAIINVSVLDAGDEFGAATAVGYDGETATERRTRRRARWTPAVVVER